jgi:hypothetical protein
LSAFRFTVHSTHDLFSKKDSRVLRHRALVLISMQSKQDVEAGSKANYGVYDDAHVEPERELLLPTESDSPTTSTISTPRYSLVHLVYAFVGGAALCIGARFLLDVSGIAGPPQLGDDVRVQAPPYAGSTEVHQFPPVAPTNAFPDLFPTRCASLRSVGQN